mgnify:CR=1 FL=1
MNNSNASRAILSIMQLYSYACLSLFGSFILPLLFEPLKAGGSAILNNLVTFELSPLLSTLAYGFVVATLYTFAWNFLLGAGLQILSGLFGLEIPKIILIGRAALIGFIYGATSENIARTLKYDITNYTILAIVVLTEFFAYSIATYGGVRIGKILVTPHDGTISQKILDVLKGPAISTYRNTWGKLKTEMRETLRLCPLIAMLLLFSATLEIWLVIS